MTSRKLTELMRFEPPAGLLPMMLPTTGIEEFELSQMFTILEEIRDQIGKGHQPRTTEQEVVDERLENWRFECFELPARILGQYEADRHGSQLARILSKTKRMMAVVDRVIVLGIGGFCSGPKALMDACCQPYFNDLSRGQRGSRPRLYFVDECLDNDAVQGLLQMLGAQRPFRPQSVEDSWAVVAIGDSTGSIESRAAITHLLDALEASCDGNQEKVRERFIPITGTSGFLRHIAEQRGHSEIFPIPEKSPACFSVMSAAGLIPAALMGINVIWLLTGGVRIYEHFLREKFSENMVLQFAAANRWSEARQGASTRAMRVWSRSLENAVRWYDLLLKDCLGGRSPAVFSITNAQQGLLSHDASGPDFKLPSWGKRQGIIHNLIVEKYRFDPLPVSSLAGAEIGLDHSVETSLPELLSSVIERSNQAITEEGCLAAKLIFPRIDEYFMGQFFQMLTLATAIEVSLLGADPYGQAAGEPYKGNINRIFGL
jgi:glucose-6-phosphate isomerase